ncbi:hypothetical protein PWT90_01100 [Aphanocladium album]|nr:hypothetical protein PWT90_01100 [Aphanocladium album]
MFELPEAKRVRREDLGDSDESDVDGADGIVHDEAMQARLNAQIAAALGLDEDEGDAAFDHEPSVPSEKLQHKTRQANTTLTTADDDDSDGNDENADEHDAEQGYEFNLFSTAGAGGASGPAKVILEDEAETAGEGGFVRPRPLSHYAAKAPSAREKEQYSYAAVTADDVVQWSAQRSWGMEMPWKVISITATRKAEPGDKSVEILMETTGEAAAKRKRPGKKQRVLLRQRKKSKTLAAEDAAKQQVEKEEHLKDKKKRLNRIKKLRKRAKDKEKKLAAGEEPDADAASGSDGAE